MPERTTVTQVTQIGVEATPGTSVAASKRLAGLSVSLNPNISTRRHRPEGYKYPTVQSLGKDFSEGPIGGLPTYDELIYVLSSLLGPAVITTPAEPTARDWTWTPSTTADDAQKTLTIERGSSLRAHKATYGIVRELGFTGNREEVGVNGSLMARAIQDGITLTAAPTELPMIPIDPDDVSVYLDTTSAGLGTTKLLRVLNWGWSVGDKVNGLWVVDAAQPSWVAHVEAVPNLQTTLRVEADAQGMALLGNLRAGDTRFLRIEAIGPVIGGAVPYKFRLDTAVKIGAIGNFEDEDGVYAIQFTGNGVHNGTWGKAMQVALTNTQTVL